MSLFFYVMENCNLERTIKRQWDYLEVHVYDQWDLQLQEFFMDVSVVEEFTVQLAAMLTGRRDVEKLISQAEKQEISLKYVVQTESGDAAGRCVNLCSRDFADAKSQNRSSVYITVQGYIMRLTTRSRKHLICMKNIMIWIAFQDF